MAGAMVDFMRSLGYTDEDIRCVADMIPHHMVVQEDQGLVPDCFARVPLFPSRN